MISGRWRRTGVDLSWGRLNVWHGGRGPLVVCLHGLGGSGRYWTGLQHLLHDHTVVAPDLAGFGRSDQPQRRYDREFHLGNLTALVDWAGENQPIVLGHSVGGVLAALWAARNPVSGLALLGTPFPRRELMPAAAQRIALSESPDRGQTARRVFRTLWPAASMVTRATRRYPGALVADYGRQSVTARADTMWSLIGDTSVIDDLSDLSSLSARSLLMAAADDRYVTAKDLERWQRLIPTAEIRRLPVGGHQFLLRGGFNQLASWLNR